MESETRAGKCKTAAPNCKSLLPEEKAEKPKTFKPDFPQSSCRTVAMDRLISVSPTIETFIKKAGGECFNGKYGNMWNAGAWEMPAWTANVFPILLTEMQKLGKKMSTCTVGVAPTVLSKAPSKATGLDDGKTCKTDGDCKSMFCEDGFWSDTCKTNAGLKLKLAAGASCTRNWQCLSKQCDDNLLGDTCAKIKMSGENTCVSTLNQLMDLMTNNGKPGKGIYDGINFQLAMGANFNAAFGIMKKAEADTVCKGYKPPIRAAVSAPGAAQRFKVTTKAHGSCTQKEALSLIIGKTGDLGKAWFLMDYFSKKLDKWGDAVDAQQEKAMANLLPHEKYTVDWTASFFIGTTFGGLGFGSDGGGVGFCTPDTNNIQTSLPLLSYSSSFGPAVKERDQGEWDTGFQLLVAPIPTIAITLKVTRNSLTKAFSPSVNLMLCLGVNNMGSHTGGEGIFDMIGPAIGPVMQILSELFIAADMSFALAKATVIAWWHKLKGAFSSDDDDKENTEDGLKWPASTGVGLKVLGKLLVMGAQSGLSMLAGIAGAALPGPSSSFKKYIMVNIEASWGGNNRGLLPTFAFNAVIFNVLELQLKIPAVGTIKPMFGWGTTIDLGSLFNEKDTLELTDKEGKPLITPEADRCKKAAIAKAVKADPEAKKAKPLLYYGQGCEKDRRGTMCKTCCALMSGVRPQWKNEPKTVGSTCDAGSKKSSVPSSTYGKRGWYCNGSPENQVFYKNAGTGLDMCKKMEFDVSTSLCERTQLQVKTFVGTNTESSMLAGLSFGLFGDDSGNVQDGFIRTNDKYQLYTQATNQCKGSNDPHCFNAEMCRNAGVACFE